MRRAEIKESKIECPYKPDEASMQIRAFLDYVLTRESKGTDIGIRWSNPAL